MDHTCLENILTHTTKPIHTQTCLSTNEYIFNIEQVLISGSHCAGNEKVCHCLGSIPCLPVQYVLPNPAGPVPMWVMATEMREETKASGRAMQAQPLCSSSCQGDAVHSVSKSEQLSHLQTDLQATTSMLWPVVKKWAKPGKNNYGHQ